VSFAIKLSTIPAGHNVICLGTLYVWTPHVHNGRTVYLKGGDIAAPTIFKDDSVVVEDAGVSETYLTCVGAKLPQQAPHHHACSFCG